MPLKLLQPQQATPAQQEVKREPVFLDDTEMAAPHTSPIRDFEDKSLQGEVLQSTRPSEEMRAPVAESIPVFTDQAEADLTLEADKPLTFNQAFKDARTGGKKFFKHRGSKFHTRWKDEKDDDWATVLKDNKSPSLTDFIVGFTRERDVADIPVSKEVGNRLYQTKHPMDAGGSNVLLASVGGIDPSGEHPPEPVHAIPTMIDGIKMSGRAAARKYHDMGLMDSAPEFKTVDEAEDWIAENHGKISPEGVLLSEDQGGGFLKVKNTRTAPTFKMLETMKAPVEKKATHAASPRIVTDELNVKREAEGLVPLTMTSGYRSAQDNATAMMNNVEAAGSIEQARANGYTGKHYQKALNDYYTSPTRANLEAIGYIRMEREKVISGGHAGGDSADYSVKDLTNRVDALRRVRWLIEQGYRVRLENWSGLGKGKNAHIHIDGIKHNA